MSGSRVRGAPASPSRRAARAAGGLEHTHLQATQDGSLRPQHARATPDPPAAARVRSVNSASELATRSLYTINGV